MLPARACTALPSSNARTSALSPSTEEYRFGWWHSPLFHYRSERTLTLERGAISVSRRGGMTVGWLSWSSLTLAVGIGLFWLAGKLRPVATPG